MWMSEIIIILDIIIIVLPHQEILEDENSVSIALLQC